MKRPTDLFRRGSRLARGFFLALLVTAEPGSASERPTHCQQNDPHCVATGTWEAKVALGAGARTNPIAGADNVPLVLIPQLTYYGKRFFFDTMDLGYTLVDEPRWMMNLLVTPSDDGLYFFDDDWGRFFLDGGLSSVGINFSPAPEKTDDLNESPAVGDPDDGPQQMPQEQESPAPSASKRAPAPALRDRNIAALGGLEASGDMGRFQWQLQALSDVSGVHDGKEVRFAVSTGTEQHAHQLGVSLGFSWKSAEVMEYYYGVTQGESSQGRPVYRPGSGTSPFVRLSWSRPISAHWRWLGSLQFEQLSDAVRHSPLTDRNNVMQVFLGGVYHF